MGQKRSVEFLANRETWITLMQREREPQQQQPQKIQTDQREWDKGKEISVCVRIRPLLDYELDAGFFGTVVQQEATLVQVLDPKMDVRGKPRLNSSEVCVRRQHHLSFPSGNSNCSQQIDLFFIFSFPRIFPLGRKSRPSPCTSLWEGRSWPWAWTAASERSWPTGRPARERPSPSAACIQ